MWVSDLEFVVRCGAKPNGVTGSACRACALDTVACDDSVCTRCHHLCATAVLEQAFDLLEQQGGAVGVVVLEDLVVEAHYVARCTAKCLDAVSHQLLARDVPVLGDLVVCGFVGCAYLAAASRRPCLC